MKIFNEHEYASAEFQMHYQNNLESVYCMSGEGETLGEGKNIP